MKNVKPYEMGIHLISITINIYIYLIINKIINIFLLCISPNDMVLHFRKIESGLKPRISRGVAFLSNFIVAKRWFEPLVHVASQGFQR